MRPKSFSGELQTKTETPAPAELHLLLPSAAAQSFERSSS